MSSLAIQPISNPKSDSLEVLITDILEGFPSSDTKVQFCYLVAKGALQSLTSHQYIDFDAQTTSNCCHGISILARDLILKTHKEDLFKLHQKIEKALETQPKEPIRVPKSLVDLSQLYILAYIREIDPEKGVRSSYKRLAKIVNLGSQFADNLVKRLQKKYSNIVAKKYESLLNEIPKEVRINNAPIDIWGKYVTEKYLRTDSRGVLFASCLFSMQVSLAYLISQKAKIAVVNDIYNEKSNILTQKYIRILELDKYGKFAICNKIDSSEPIIVFGGCSYTSNSNEVIQKMDEWLEHFPELVLANDIKYPQFPKTHKDVDFRDDPIIPDEVVIKMQIEKHTTCKGVSATDPSLFCLNHIFPTGGKFIAEKDLPSYKIPSVLTS